MRAMTCFGCLASLLLPGVALAQVEPEPPSPPPASAPIAKDPTPPPPALPPRPEEERSGGSAGGIAIGVGGQYARVEQEQNLSTSAAGLAIVATMMGFGEPLSGRGHAAVFFGGGSGGPEGAYALDLHVGLGSSPTKGTQLFARLGAEAYAAKNDEIEAGLTMLPALALGFSAVGHGVAFEIAPRGGITGRTEYEPGDESQGRRHWRRVRPRVAYGGVSTLATDYFVVNGSLVRLADSDPVTVFAGDVCGYAFGILALCFQMQRWESIAARADNGVVSTIPFTYLGGMLGFGVAKSGALWSGTWGK